MKISLESAQHFPCQRTCVTVTGKINYKNQGWLRKGSKREKEKLTNKGGVVIGIISFSNIFRGFHYEISEEVSFDTAQVLLRLFTQESWHSKESGH